jgi:hypothetical protein
MPQILKNRIIWDYRDWLAGLHPQFGNALFYPKIFRGFEDQESFDPFRLFGYASPGYAPTDATNVTQVDTMIKAGITQTISASTYAYYLSNTEIYRSDVAGIALQADDKWPHTIAGTTVVGEDMKLYTINGVEYMIASFNDNTNGDLTRILGGAGTFVENYLTHASYLNKTGMSKSNPHPMIVGDDDILYVADGNLLHALDGSLGTYGTWYASALTLPRDMKIRSFAKVKNGLVIITDSSPTYGATYGKAKAWFWDYSSLDPYDVIDLGDASAGASFQYKDTFGVFTIGKIQAFRAGTTSSKLLLFIGNGFKTVAYFDDALPSLNGVMVLGDMILWNSSGIIYSYGNNFKYDASLNKIARCGGDSSGLLVTFNGNQFIASSGTATTGGLQTWNNYNLGSFTTSFAEPIFEHGKIGRITDMTIRFAKASTGGRSLLLQLKDRNNTAKDIIATSEVFTVVATDTIVKAVKGLDFRFDAIKLYGVWDTGSGASDAPIISTVEAIFESINI